MKCHNCFVPTISHWNSGWIRHTCFAHLKDLHKSCQKWRHIMFKLLPFRCLFCSQGFVRLAMEHGVPIVPVYVFGQSVLWSQLPLPRIMEPWQIEELVVLHFWKVLLRREQRSYHQVHTSYKSSKDLYFRCGTKWLVCFCPESCNIYCNIFIYVCGEAPNLLILLWCLICI